MACIASGFEEIRQQQQCLASSSLAASTTSLKPSQGQLARPPNLQASGINVGEPSETKDAQTQQREAYWLVAEETNGMWKQLRNMSLRGAMLIRPDGHIAWRCNSFSHFAAVSDQQRFRHQDGRVHDAQHQESNSSVAAGRAEPDSRVSCRNTEAHGQHGFGIDASQQSGLQGFVSCLVTDQERSHAEKLVSAALQSLLH